MLGKPGGSGRCDERMRVAAVLGRSPMPVPTCVDQHGTSGDIEWREQSPVHIPRLTAKDADDDAVQVDGPRQRKSSQIRTIGEAMRGGVEIGAGGGDDGAVADPEFGAGYVARR